MECGHGVQELQGTCPGGACRASAARSPLSPPLHACHCQGEKRTLFDAQKDGQKIAPKWVAPEDEQEAHESRRLWTRLTRAIGDKDMDAATEAKTAVEESQREARRRMDERGEVHVPRFFHLKDGRWLPKVSYVSICCFLPFAPFAPC